MTAAPGTGRRTKHRLEHDSLGPVRVPASAYYGAHTARAVDNVPVTGVPIGRYAYLVRALAEVKRAAAVANLKCGELEGHIGEAIVAACETIREGGFAQYFVVDALQGGAGTSTNMNANEVIANVANIALGGTLGVYDPVHPLEHVNRSQSTNDVYPTAVNLAVRAPVHELTKQIRALAASWREKAQEHESDRKMGRTQLQDAVPLTYGQEYRAIGHLLDQDARSLTLAVLALDEVNLGGTAIGTGLNAPGGYAEEAIAELRRRTGAGLAAAQDRIAATQDAIPLLRVSAALRSFAVRLSKLCNDLRLLSSGPDHGFGEIVLPPVQVGSSMMPGKVNPVLPEVVNQICFQVIGNDTAAAYAAEAGQLQLNPFLPLIARNLFESAELLSTACALLRTRCVDGLVVVAAAPGRIPAVSVTELSAVIGYERACEVHGRAAALGTGLFQAAVDVGIPGEALSRCFSDAARRAAPEQRPATADAAVTGRTTVTKAPQQPVARDR